MVLTFGYLVKLRSMKGELPASARAAALLKHLKTTPNSEVRSTSGKSQMALSSALSLRLNPGEDTEATSPYGFGVSLIRFQKLSHLQQQ